MWRIGSAAIGALLLARFVLGTPQALKGPTSPAISATSVIANVGTVYYRVGGKSSFFSLVRGFQLLGLIVCIASHLVVFQAPVKEKANGHDERPELNTRSHRVTA
jgi:hypothetical protein